MPFFPPCTASPARLHSRPPCFARRPRLCPRVHFSRPSVCNNTGVRLCKRHVYAHLPCRNRPEKVALTFNCTYSAQDMQQLLEILKEKNVHATFFVSDAWAKTIRSCSVRFTTPDTISAVCGQRRHLFPSGNRPSHWKISRSELIALPILKRRCFVLKTETMTTLLSGSSRNPAVIRCSGTSIPWTGKTTGHRTSSIGF